LKKAAQKLFRLQSRDFRTPLALINKSLFDSFSSEKEVLDPVLCDIWRPEARLGMRGDDTDLGTKTVPKIERPRLYKVILVNDDFTPREFVVFILKAEFRMNEAQAQQVMLTAHRRGACVVAVYTQEIAETKATRATDAARKKGYPLLFTTEPEE